MSTRSLIGIKKADGRVRYVYCHSDGYIEKPGVGYMLHTFWNNEAAVAAMIELGHLSVLGEHIGEKHDFRWMFSSEFDGADGIERRHADPRSKFCRFYGRDRGDTDVETQTADDANAFWQSSMDTEFWYLYADGAWWVKGYADDPPELLEHALPKAEAAAKG